MFTFEDFDIKLDTDYIGRNFIYCDEIESTNLYLMEADDSTQDGTVVLAEKQLNGRGRKNRKWYSVKDQNLTFSILLRRKFDQKKINMMNFCASMAIAHSMENLYQFKINLKWPNDVLVGQEKIAGILIESSSKGNQIDKVVIGIGINVNQSIFQGQYNIAPTSVRQELGHDVERERLLSEILNNFEILLEKAYEAPEQLMEDWKSRCRMLGERIVVSDEEMSKSGIFEDLDESGFLVLRTDNRTTEKIYFGDVSLR